MVTAINDLPVQYKPFLKAIQKGFQQILEDLASTTATKDQKIAAISTLWGIMDANIKRVEHYVRTGVVDAEAEMDTAIASQASSNLGQV